ncbi:hypothetical protein N7537_012057 [Penicillium hordei]|uniref:Uncharacterized protein n=1 Tax=Penicillium hordei TaxID=40994 RepID=A0AAD6GVB3_9EURO|nr:uncharacterized protein N7537_012057 [Penicillium hordei]KAJ5589379.1 hypothetical protein N7537_012057 [Penicillium hordei]
MPKGHCHSLCMVEKFIGFSGIKLQKLMAESGWKTRARARSRERQKADEKTRRERKRDRDRRGDRRGGPT